MSICLLMGPGIPGPSGSEIEEMKERGGVPV